MEGRIDDNVSSKYIVGESITIADFHNAGIAYSYFYNDHLPQFKEMHKKMLKEHKVVDKYFKGLGEVLKEYLNERTKPLYPY